MIADPTSSYRGRRLPGGRVVFAVCTRSPHDGSDLPQEFRTQFSESPRKPLQLDINDAVVIVWFHREGILGSLQIL